MKSKKLTHEPFKPYQQALRLLDAVLEVAQTRHRPTNERLGALATRVLEHAAAAGAEPSGPGRSRMLQYCRVTMAKLAAVVVAAHRRKLISDAQAEDAREQMLVMEGLLQESADSRPPRSPAVDTTDDAS